MSPEATIVIFDKSELSITLAAILCILKPLLEKSPVTRGIH